MKTEQINCVLDNKKFWKPWVRFSHHYKHEPTPEEIRKLQRNGLRHC